MIQQPISRRAWIAALVTGASAASAACSASATTEIQTPEGPVLQWEGSDLLVLVSGYQRLYRAGDTIKVNIVINNQSTRLGEVNVRTRLLGRGDQAVAEAEAVRTTVPTEGAISLDREIPISLTMPPGDYTLSVEIPQWKLNGVQSGPGATLRTPVQITSPS